MGPIHSFDDIKDMVRRRFWLIAALVVIGSVASVMFALSRPHVYLSSEVLQIERPKIADELAPSTVEGASARRLQLIEQQLMARDTVLDIIEQHDLFANLPALSPTEKVAMFREAVTIEGVAATREGGVDDGTVSALTIMALLGSAEKAQAVAHELGSRTVELSARARTDKTKATLDFFLQEEAALVEAIAELESEIAEFRSSNATAIAGSVEFQQVEARSINDAVVDVERSLITLQEEVLTLQAGQQRPAVTRRIAALGTQVRSLEEQKEFLEQRSQELQQSLTTSPEVERMTNIFQLRLEQYQDQLAEISARRADAEIGHRLESNRQSERILILEPASLPEYPASSSRKKLAAMGGVASILGALFVAFLFELRNPVVRTGAQLHRELGILPAACIPTAASSPTKRPSRIKAIIRRVKDRVRGLKRFIPQRTAKSERANGASRTEIAMNVVRQRRPRPLRA